METYNYMVQWEKCNGKQSQQEIDKNMKRYIFYEY
jgi:hypothetical protein